MLPLLSTFSSSPLFLSQSPPRQSSLSATCISTSADDSALPLAQMEGKPRRRAKKPTVGHASHRSSIVTTSSSSSSSSLHYSSTTLTRLAAILQMMLAVAALAVNAAPSSPQGAAAAASNVIVVPLAGSEPSPLLKSTCAQAFGGSSKADEEKVLLCQLYESSALLAELGALVSQGLDRFVVAAAAAANQQIDGAQQPPNWEREKKKHEYLRFGKRKHEYLRFGKRKHEYLRFGRK